MEVGNEGAHPLSELYSHVKGGGEHRDVKRKRKGHEIPRVREGRSLRFSLGKFAVKKEKRPLPAGKGGWEGKPTPNDLERACSLRFREFFLFPRWRRKIIRDLRETKEEEIRTLRGEGGERHLPFSVLPPKKGKRKRLSKKRRERGGREAKASSSEGNTRFSSFTFQGTTTTT